MPLSPTAKTSEEPLPATSLRYTDVPELMEDVFSAAAEARAAFLLAVPLFLASATRSYYLAFIKRAYPHLADRYSRYYSRGADPPEFYREDLNRRLTALGRRHHIEASVPFEVPKSRQDLDGQLDFTSD